MERPEEFRPQENPNISTQESAQQTKTRMETLHRAGLKSRGMPRVTSSDIDTNVSEFLEVAKRVKKQFPKKTQDQNPEIS